MENIITKNSLNDFSDRDLFELILAIQVKLCRRVRGIENTINKIKDTTEPHYMDTFRGLSIDANEILEQINLSLRDK